MQTCSTLSFSVIALASESSYHGHSKIFISGSSIVDRFIFSERSRYPNIASQWGECCE
jgi:hypothetical protein